MTLLFLFIFTLFGIKLF